MRFFQKLFKRPTVKSTPDRSPGNRNGQNGRENVRQSRKHRSGVLTPRRYKMNELTDKIWGDMEARLVDIKYASADQTEETQRYVFGVLIRFLTQWLPLRSDAVSGPLQKVVSRGANRIAMPRLDSRAKRTRPNSIWSET